MIWNICIDTLMRNIHMNTITTKNIYTDIRMNTTITMNILMENIYMSINTDTNTAE